MFAAVSQLMPAAARFFRQIVPPVIATLIAAVLISAYNQTFSGHLSQPRMSALHAEENAAPTAPITTVGMTKPAPAPVTETITIYEDVIEPERLSDKDAKEEAGKDQTAVKLAAEPAPAPVRTVAQAPRPEPKAEVRYEPRPEARRLAAVELAQPVMRAPAPVIVAVPPSVVSAPTTAPVVAAMPVAQEQRPPQYQQQQQYQQPQVIMGTPPMVTVPDRPSARSSEEAQVQPPAPPHGPIGTFVNVFKPSNWFARAREFGEKIEQAGNDILPSIRQ